MKFNEDFLHHLRRYRQSATVQAKQQTYLTLLKPMPGQSILDLGCGSGEFCRILAPLVAPSGQITGLDLSPDAIQLSRELSEEINPALLTFEMEDGHQLSFADSSFDAAVCFSVLTFCVDPVAVLAELRRVLKPGGRLLIANADEDLRAFNSYDLDLGRRMMRAIANRGHHPWLGRRLAYLLRTAGFKIIEEQVMTTVEHDYNPETGGYVLAHGLRKHLLTDGAVASHEYEAWLADLQACATEGCYTYSSTTYLYMAEA